MGYYRSECFYFIYKLTKRNTRMLHLLYKSCVIIGVSVFYFIYKLTKCNTRMLPLLYKSWVIIGVSVFILFINLPNVSLSYLFCFCQGFNVKTVLY